MSSNCPVGCIHCAEENISEAEDRAIHQQEREEDDANFSDQEPPFPEEESLKDLENNK
jgi:hypothetical protein